MIQEKQENQIPGNIIQITGDGINEPFLYTLQNPLFQLNQNTTPPPLIIQNGFSSGNSDTNQYVVTLENPFPNQILMVNITGCMQLFYNDALLINTPVKWLPINNNNSINNKTLTFAGFSGHNIPADNVIYIFDVQYTVTGY